MPPTAQRLREAAAVVLLAFGIISTLFNTITLLFSPNGCYNSGIGAMTCTGSQGGTLLFSYRALGATGSLLNPVVIFSVALAAVLVHVPPRPRMAKGVALTAVVCLAAAGIFGLIALFASLGADRAAGFMKATNFFVGFGELAITAVAAWLSLAYFRMHGPARPAGAYGPPPAGQWGPPPQQWHQQQPQQQTQQQQTQQQPPQQWQQPPQQWGPQ